MPKLSFSLILVVLAVSSIASAAAIRFNESLFNQTDCSLNNCSFAWNEKGSWIGGRVPGRNDDVFISNSPYQIQIHCPYFCEARSISGNNLFINMTKMNALVNVTQFNVNSISFENGVLRSSLILANETVEFDGVVTINAATLTVSAKAFRLTDSNVDLVSLNAAIVSSHSSKLQIDDTLVAASEWSVQSSTLRFYGTCECPVDTTSTANNVMRGSEVHVRTSCSFCLDDSLTLRESSWIIESVASGNETTSYELTRTEFDFSESTLAVADNVKLVVNQTLALTNGRIQASNAIHIADFGTIEGSGTIESSVTADHSSYLATRHGDLIINGLVTLNEGSTLQIQNGTFYVTTLQIFNNTKLSIEEGSTNTELVVATDLIAGSFSDLDFYDPTVQLVYNYTHIFIQTGANNEPHTSDEPSSDAPQGTQQPYHRSPTSSVNAPTGEESAGTDGKVVAIVILSILLGMMTIAVAALVFKMKQLQAGYLPLSSKVLPFSDDEI